MKVILITRATSGTGKSTLSETLYDLLDERYSGVICTADEFMVDNNGNYEFKPEKLGYSHNKCREKFDNALKNEINLIIVANTNTKYQDYRYYLDEGKKNGYLVFVTVLEKYHNNENIHGVPLDTLIRQENNIKNSLKLR